jgi:flavin-binding protein dodecin
MGNPQFGKVVTLYLISMHMEESMSEHVYQIVEMVGSSKNGIEDAVKNALATIGETQNNIRWFQVIETRGQVDGSKIAYWQVTVKVGVTAE